MKSKKKNLFVCTIECCPNFQRGVICIIHENATCDGNHVEGMSDSPKAKYLKSVMIVHAYKPTRIAVVTATNTIFIKTKQCTTYYC